MYGYPYVTSQIHHIRDDPVLHIRCKDLQITDSTNPVANAKIPRGIQIRPDLKEKLDGAIKSLLDNPLLTGMSQFHKSFSFVAG